MAHRFHTFAELIAWLRQWEESQRTNDKARHVFHEIIKSIEGINARDIDSLEDLAELLGVKMATSASTIAIAAISKITTLQGEVAPVGGAVIDADDVNNLNSLGSTSGAGTTIVPIPATNPAPTPAGAPATTNAATTTA